MLHPGDVTPLCLCWIFQPCELEHWSLSGSNNLEFQKWAISPIWNSKLLRILELKAPKSLQSRSKKLPIDLSNKTTETVYVKWKAGQPWYHGVVMLQQQLLQVSLRVFDMHNARPGEKSVCCAVFFRYAGMESLGVDSLAKLASWLFELGMLGRSYKFCCKIRGPIESTGKLFLQNSWS